MNDAQGKAKAPQSTQNPQFPAIFWALLALTAGVRLIAVCRPLVGCFATKNVVYAMIARNWANGTGSLLCPTLDVLCGGQRAWHMVEFPAAAYLTGSLWGIFGGSLDVWGRAMSVAMSVGSVALLFAFVRRRHGRRTAAGAAFMLAASPVSIIYGQSFMLEPSVVFLTLAAFYSLDRYLHAARVGWLIVAAVALSILLLTKIYMIVLLLPFAVMWMNGRTERNPAMWIGCLGAALTIIPAACWYAFAYWTATPESGYADRVFYAIRDSGVAHWNTHSLLLLADFYRQLLDGATTVVLTPIGLMLCLAGLLDRRWRQYIPWLAAMLILVFALPRKFYEMNYYWVVVLPPLCILAGLGWDKISRRMQPGRLATTFLALALLGFSLRYAAKPAFFTPSEDRAVVAAGRAVMELAQPDEPVVAMHGTTIDLLYYSNRPGWAVSCQAELIENLPRYAARGARYVVVVGEELPRFGPPVERGSRYQIYRLSSFVP